MNWVEPGERLQVYNNYLFSQDVHVFVSTRLLNKSMQIIIFYTTCFFILVDNFLLIVDWVEPGE